MFASESKRAILVVRGELQATLGSDVPFYEQSSLGGQNNLRGFGVDRYIDKQLIAFSIEERIHILRTRLAGVMADFEIAPFIDTGQVFNSYKNVSFKDYRITPGIGFRGIIRPNVVGRIDYGFSKEGGAIFAGLRFSLLTKPSGVHAMEQSSSSFFITRPMRASSSRDVS